MMSAGDRGAVPSIEQDFVFLNRWLNERGGERAKAALSRIQAEAERLRAEAAQRWEQHTHLRETELEAEVERLQEAYRIEQETHRRTTAERERLQIKLTEAVRLATKNGLENDRLRANLKTTVENRDAWLAEVERLRAALERIRMLCKEAKKPGMWGPGMPPMVFAPDIDDIARQVLEEKA